jgi:hypothetical protein
VLVHVCRSLCGNAAVQDIGDQMARSNATHNRSEHALRGQRVEQAGRISDDKPAQAIADCSAGGTLPAVGTAGMSPGPADSPYQ